MRVVRWLKGAGSLGGVWNWTLAGAGQQQVRHLTGKSDHTIEEQLRALRNVRRGQREQNYRQRTKSARVSPHHNMVFVVIDADQRDTLEGKHESSTRPVLRNFELDLHSYFSASDGQRLGKHEDGTVIVRLVQQSR
jgi:hypothetical protein